MENIPCFKEINQILSAYNPHHASTIKMMLYRNRLQTFTKWPFSAEDKNTKCSPENMAVAGFYSISKKKGDTSVKCFCCLKELEGWEAQDVPWEEHRKHQNQCPFIMLNKTEEAWTLEHWVQLQQTVVVKLLELELQEDLEILKEEYSMLQVRREKEQKKKRR